MNPRKSFALIYYYYRIVAYSSTWILNTKLKPFRTFMESRMQKNAIICLNGFCFWFEKSLSYLCRKFNCLLLIEISWTWIDWYKMYYVHRFVLTKKIVFKILFFMFIYSIFIRENKGPVSKPVIHNIIN